MCQCWEQSLVQGFQLANLLLLSFALKPLCTFAITAHSSDDSTCLNMHFARQSKLHSAVEWAWFQPQVNSLHAAIIQQPAHASNPGHCRSSNCTQLLCRVVKLVRALRNGWLKPPSERPVTEDGEQEEEPPYMMWQDDGLAADKTAIGGITLCLLGLLTIQWLLHVSHLLLSVSS